jgi:lipopolysaccharide export system permease protein
MILDRYLVKQFIPVFLFFLSMCVLILSLVDLFMNLWRYLNNEAPLLEILRVTLFYLPKCISYALPISLLFASAYILGDLYARNELTTVFASGIPFWRFSVSLLIIGLFASVFIFFFDDIVVIPTLKKKNELSRILLRQQRTENNSYIVIKARNGELIYSVDYYDNVSRTLNGVIIIETNDQGGLVSIIRAPRAVWVEDHWDFSNPVIYEWSGDFLQIRTMEKTDAYQESPDTFRRNMVIAEELSVRDAGFLIQDLRNAGLPYIEALADYYHRFSFPTTSFVVMILSISMGGRFRKNILLASLIAGLAASVVFYVVEMLTMMMARLGYIPPPVGAWFPVFIFIILGILFLRTTKT